MNMNDQHLIRIKSDIKSELIDYFDEIKIEIDIDAQKKLMYIDEFCGDINKNYFLSLYNYLIQKVDSIFNSSCNDIDDFIKSENFQNKFYESNKELIKTNGIKNFCFYLSNDFLKLEYKDINPIGLFIVCDWYLDDNQRDYIKYHNLYLNIF
jgi:hypothetical protein